MLDKDGNVFCYAPTLQRRPFVQREDALSDFIARLDKEGLHEPGGFKIFLDASPLSQKKFGLSPREFYGLISGFSGNYVFSDVVTETLSSDAQSFAFLAASETGKKLNLKAASPEFDRYIFDYAEMDPQLARSPDRWISQESTAALSAGEVVFGLGAALLRPVWAASKNSNLLFYRAVQRFPSGFVLEGENAEAVRREIQELYKLEEPKEKKPVANIVLAPDRSFRFTLPEMLNGVVNSLTANGFEVRVSFETFLKEASLYYVIGRQDWLNNLNFFNRLVRLLNHRKSRFYGPVILHPLGEIRERGRWQDIRKHFRIPATEVGWIDEVPPFVKERGVKIAWGGDEPPRGSGMTVIRADPARHAGGEILLSEMVGTQTLALILKSGNHYLINGGPLHFEAGYILSQLYGGGLKTPAQAYVTAGRYRSAALALEDTRLTLKIPTPEPPREWRKIIFDGQGRRVEDTLIPGADTVTEDLNAGELWILSAQRPSLSEEVPLP